MPGGEDTGPQSGFRFEELLAQPGPEQADAAPAPREETQVTVERRYAALEESHARVGTQLQMDAEFGATARDVTEERFGAAKDEPAPPMQRDTPPEASQQRAQERASGGSVEQTPFGPMYRPPQQAVQDQERPQQ